MNPNTPNIEPKPPTQIREAVAGVFLKAILAGLLLAVAIEVPVLAQTTNVTDDGTVLKEIIIFGRHSIRAPTSQYTGPNGLNQFAPTSSIPALAWWFQKVS